MLENSLHMTDSWFPEQNKHFDGTEESVFEDSNDTLEPFDPNLGTEVFNWLFTWVHIFGVLEQFTASSNDTRFLT